MQHIESYPRNLGLEFASVVRRFPDRVALHFHSPQRIVRYRELDVAANELASILAARGIGIGAVVAIVHSKTAECYGTMLACLKLGAVYVNIDEDNPQARLELIFSTAKPSLVVVDGLSTESANVFETLGVPICNLQSDAIRHELVVAAKVAPQSDALITGADPAYIMFTSGSTGIPKGVVIRHESVLNFVRWAAESFAITENDVLTNINPMYFDNSVFDFYVALFNGASLVPIDCETIANPLSMLDVVEATRATIWFSVPSLLVYLMTLEFLGSERLHDLRAFIFGGEAYPKPELRRLFRMFGAAKKLYNVYGPTECTCICSSWRVTESDLDEPYALVTLGPIAKNFRAFVLDDELQPTKPGEVGELYLGGPQVGAGYINDAVRTKSAFVQNPLHQSWNDVVYRTGDLVRMRADGRIIDFVGRKDNQIKHMGYRIELEEIENALSDIAEVVEAAAIQIKDGDGLSMLVAHVSLEREISISTIRAALKKRLPPYMIPEKIVRHRSLPKNANGKIDRRGLSEAAVAANE